VTTDLAFYLLTYPNPFPNPFPVVTPSPTNPVNPYMTVAD
jgi:hypothetical protein